MAVGGHACPGSAADSTRRHRFRIEKAHLETARARARVCPGPVEEEDTREMKSRIILTGNQVWELNPSAQHPGGGNKMGFGETLILR